MKTKILIVLNNSTLKDHLASRLKTVGRFEVETATDPHDAFHHLVSRPVDFLIMDHRGSRLDEQLLLNPSVGPAESTAPVAGPRLILVSPSTLQDDADGRPNDFTSLLEA